VKAKAEAKIPVSQEGKKCGCVVNIEEPKITVDKDHDCPNCMNGVNIHTGVNEGPDGHLHGWDRFGV
jgi:hypothetical protein